MKAMGRGIRGLHVQKRSRIEEAREETHGEMNTFLSSGIKQKRRIIRNVDICLEAIPGNLDTTTGWIYLPRIVIDVTMIIARVIIAVLAWKGEAIGELEVWHQGHVIIEEKASEVQAWRGEAIGGLAVFRRGDMILAVTAIETNIDTGMAQGKRMAIEIQGTDQASFQQGQDGMRTAEDQLERMTHTTEEQKAPTEPGSM
jgi:hypothetical protein